MTRALGIVLLVAVAAHVLLVLSMLKVSARADRAARQRRYDLNQSITNRRL